MRLDPFFVFCQRGLKNFSEETIYFLRNKTFLLKETKVCEKLSLRSVYILWSTGCTFIA